MHIGSGIYSLAEFSAPTLFNNANSPSERIQHILRGFIFYRGCFGQKCPKVCTF